MALELYTPDRDALNLAINDAIVGREWQITSVRSTRILIEPRDQTRFDPQWPYMFHVSARANRESIDEKGLEPQPGGNTSMNRLIIRRGSRPICSRRSSLV